MEGLRLVQSAIGNPALRVDISTSIAAIRDGVTLSATLGQHSLLLEPLRHAITLGEQSNRLADMRGTIARTLEMRGRTLAFDPVIPPLPISVPYAVEVGIVAAVQIVDHLPISGAPCLCKWNGPVETDVFHGLR